MNGGERLQPVNQSTERTKPPFLGVVKSEQNKPLNPRLRVFADLRTGDTQGDIGKRIVYHIRKMSEAGASRQNAQMAVSGITHELLTATIVQSQCNDVLLIPVLRAGVAMWNTANEFFRFPETSFVWGVKEKGTDRAHVLWPKRNSMDGKRVFILDPIIATGDTLVQVSESVRETTGIISFTVLSCYAAPEGVQAVLDKTHNLNLVVGCMSKTLDTNGYLVPPTQGDMGDKLFGQATGMEP